jgi:hypothetical protein
MGCVTSQSRLTGAVALIQVARMSGVHTSSICVFAAKVEVGDEGKEPAVGRAHRAIA